MHIDYFREHQNDVFIPALGLLLISAILIALPVLFGPTLARRGRRRPLLTLCVSAAALVLVGAVAIAIPGVRTLDAQRLSLQGEVRARYGIALPLADAGRLLSGDTIRTTAVHPAQKVHLQSTGDGDYILVRAPTTAGGVLELPRT